MPGERHLGLMLFLFFLGFYALTGSGRIVSADGERVYQLTRSLVERRALDVPAYVVRPYRLIVPAYVAQDTDAQGSIGPDGKAYPAGGIGMSLIAIPLYLLGVGLSFLPTGLERDYLARFAVALLNPIVIALLCALFFRLASRLWERWTAVALALGLGLGTIFWPYSKNTFSEPLVAVALVVALLAADALMDQRRPRDAVFFGAVLGFALLVRFDVLVMLPIFLAYMIYILLARRPFCLHEAVVILLAVLVPLVVSGAVVGWSNWARFGSPLKSGYQAAVVTFPTPFWLGFSGQVLSPMKGLLWYNPAVVLATLGWPLLFRRRPALALLTAAAALAHLVFYCKLGLWEGGSWGPRYLVSTLPLYFLPLGAVLSWRRDSEVVRLAVLLAIVAGFFVQLPDIIADEGRYVQYLYQSRPENEFRAVYYGGTLADSPLIGQWRMAREVTGLVRSDPAGVLAAAFEKRAQVAREESRADGATRGASEAMALIAFNFPDFWFIQLSVFGARPWLMVAVAVVFGLCLFVGAAGLWHGRRRAGLSTLAVSNDLLPGSADERAMIDRDLTHGM